MTEEYYQITPKVNNIDFFLGDSTVFINSSITTSVDASATVIKLASSSADIQSANDFFARKIFTAASEVQIELIFETVPTEILNVLTLIDINTTVDTSASKVSFASSAISLSSDVSISIQKITEIDSYISLSTSIDSISQKVSYANALSAIELSTGFHATFIAFLYSQIGIKSKAIFKQPIRFSPNYIDESSIRTLLILDGKPLTNHQRELDVSLSPVFIENSNWNNKRTRYYKRATSSGRKTFSIKWGNLPNSLDYTVDNRQGRDYIHSIAEDPDSHELKIINQDENGLTPYTETTYTVFVKDYNETLVRRYLSEGVYLYECNLTLEEA